MMPKDMKGADAIFPSNFNAVISENRNTKDRILRVLIGEIKNIIILRGIVNSESFLNFLEMRVVIIIKKIDDKLNVAKNGARTTDNKFDLENLNLNFIFLRNIPSKRTKKNEDIKNIEKGAPKATLVVG